MESQVEILEYECTKKTESDICKFIDVLPDILVKTFELSINTKKELRIKLFDWLVSFEKVDFKLWLGM